MRRHRIACLLVLLVLCLSACKLEPSGVASKSDPIGVGLLPNDVPPYTPGAEYHPPYYPPAESPPLPSPSLSVIKSVSPAIRDVICNKREFLCAETDKPMCFKDFRSNSYLFVNDDGDMEYTGPWDSEEAKSYSQFCVVDMDGDGAQELILEESQTGNRLLLHYEDGAVYGFVFPFRGMNGIKTDGSFICSGGATVNYLKKVSFVKERVFSTDLWCVDDVGGVYRINGEDVSPKEANSYWRVEPEDAEWYAYDEADFRE